MIIRSTVSDCEHFEHSSDRLGGCGVGIDRRPVRGNAMAVLKIRGAGEWSLRRPIPQGLTAYVVSVVIRVGVGASLAAAATGSGQVSGSLAAFGLGVAAPLVLEKLAQTVPLTGTLGSATRENQPTPTRELPTKPTCQAPAPAPDPPGEIGEVSDAG